MTSPAEHVEWVSSIPATTADQPERPLVPSTAPAELVGLPWYRAADVPPTLSTEPYLKRYRRRRADDQPPVAAQRNAGPGPRWLPLYEIEAATALPPLSPAQQAKWDAARTCTRCGQVELDPCPKDRNGNRICGRPDCWATTPPTNSSTSDGAPS